ARPQCPEGHSGHGRGRQRCHPVVYRSTLSAGHPVRAGAGEPDAGWHWGTGAIWLQAVSYPLSHEPSEISTDWQRNRKKQVSNQETCFFWCVPRNRLLFFSFWKDSGRRDLATALRARRWDWALGLE